MVLSFARAIQQPALELWRGHEADAAAAQHVLHYRAWCNHAAQSGSYETDRAQSPFNLNRSATVPHVASPGSYQSFRIG